MQRPVKKKCLVVAKGKIEKGLKSLVPKESRFWLHQLMKLKATCRENDDLLGGETCDVALDWNILTLRQG